MKKKSQKKSVLSLISETRPRMILPSQTREDKRGKRLKKAFRKEAKRGEL